MSDLDRENLYLEATEIVSNLMKRFETATEVLARLQIVCALMIVVSEKENKGMAESRDDVAKIFGDSVGRIASSIEVETSELVRKH